MSDDWARQERRSGYADGKAGKPATYSNQHYQRGYREGLRALQATRLPTVNVRLGAISPYDDTHYDPLDPDDFMSGYDYDPETRTYSAQEANMSGTVKRSKLFIATVFAERSGSSASKLDSLKPGAMGGWESFIGGTKVEAINKAMTACKKWRVSPIDGAEYVIYVGTLTEKVKAPIGYELVSLNA